MIFPVRYYVVMAGTDAADPDAREVERAITSQAANDLLASLRTAARRGLLAVPAATQHFVRTLDVDADLPVASAAAAVALGYTVRASLAGEALLLGPAGAHADAGPQIEARPSFTVGTPPPVARGVPVGGAVR